MRRFFLIVLSLATVWLNCHGVARAANEVSAEGFLSVDKLNPGSSFRVAIVIKLQEPWHINANPVTTDGAIPTEVTFRAPDSITLKPPVYPKGKETKVDWADTPASLYAGRVIIFAEGSVQKNASVGPVKIEAALRYQACDDKLCYAPKDLPVVIQADIVDAAQSPWLVHPDIFASAPAPSAKTAAPPSNASSPNSIASLLKQRGLLVTLVVLFFGGLALNLTPCVYPMIAITVSYFGGQSGGKKPAAAFALATTYFLGIVVTYSSLGVVTALTGSLFGSLLQSPVLLVIVALLMVALSLSMFGLYELQPPQFLMQKATGLSSKAGFVGVFFLGAMVGVIAAPCIAPILVALLVYVGQSGNPWLGWWLFFTLAAGLGAPYIVLGTFSGLLTRLPKSGTWMVWVKRALGVLLLAVAAWFVHPLFASKNTPASLIAWQAYSAEKLQQAPNTHQPAIIDFAADWCIPCKEMDKHTFSDARVVEKSKHFLMLKADLTRTGSPEVKALTDQFHILGVPTSVFIGSDGRERSELRRVGLVGSDEYLGLMNEALAKTSSTTLSNAPTIDIPAQLLNPF